MHKVVLLRHGESVWNKENLFTGWTDVDLSDKGKQEAKEAGRLLKEQGNTFRHRLHLGVETGNPHAVDRVGRNGPHVDSGSTRLAA